MKKYIYAILLFIVFSLPLHSQQKSRLNTIISSRVLTVGVNNDYPPFFLDVNSANFPGFDIEFAKLYSEYLGVKIKFVVIEDLGELFDAIKTGKVDVGLGGISSGLERGKVVSFSQQYLKTTPAAIVPMQIRKYANEGDIVQSNRFVSIDDLKSIAGLNFCIKSNTTNVFYIKQVFQKSQISYFNTNELALKGFLENSCNVFVADSLYIYALLQMKPELKVNYLALTESVMNENISVVIPKNDLELAYDLNFFISEIQKSGVIAELKNKYFNDDKWIKKD